jgi:hypothetical protein
MTVIGCNVCFGLFTLIINMAKQLRKHLLRKAMLKKDKSIRTYMMKKYSSYALKMIV